MMIFFKCLFIAMCSYTCILELIKLTVVYVWYDINSSNGLTKANIFHKFVVSGSIISFTAFPYPCKHWNIIENQFMNKIYVVRIKFNLYALFSARNVNNIIIQYHCDFQQWIFVYGCIGSNLGDGYHCPSCLCQISRIQRRVRFSFGYDVSKIRSYVKNWRRGNNWLISQWLRL